MIRWWRAGTALVLAMGVACQVWVFTRDRALWHDELYVAYNLQHKDYLRLPGGLYWNQTAPSAWVAMEKAIFDVLGGNVYLLRFPQLLGGVLTLVFTLLVGVKAIGRPAALLATALVAISPMLLYYAAEVKPYILEACGALVIMWCAARLGQLLLFGEATRRELWRFAILTTGVMLVGFANLIALGGALAAVVLTLATQRRWRACVTVSLAGLPALLLGAGQVIVLKIYGTFMHDLDTHFANGTPGPGAGPIDVLGWLPRMWPAFVADPLRWGSPVVVLVAVITGLVAMWWRGRTLWASIFAGVLLTALVAAAVNSLPMVNRVSLYLVPVMILLVVSAIDGCVRLAWLALREPGARRIAVAVPAAGLVVATAFAAMPYVSKGAEQVAEPRTVAPYQTSAMHPDLENGRAMMWEVRQRWQPGDVLLSYMYSQPMASWYGEQFGVPVKGYVDAAATCDPASLDTALDGAARVWYVHLELLSSHPADFQARVVGELAKHGTVVASHVYGGEDRSGPAPAWLLFDLVAGPDPMAQRPLPEGVCFKVLPA